MKKTITTLMMSTLIYLLPAWNGVMAQDLLEFSGYPGNPVLTHGNPGSYDGDLLVAPYAVWDEGIFYLFYNGNAGGCLATSTDGHNYTKFAGNPIMTPSGHGFDSLGAGAGPVLRVGQKWVMYYGARQFPGWGPGESTGRATADSLTGSWERSSDPVLTIGSPGEWDEGLIYTTSVLPTDTGGFIMFYFASDDFNGIWLMGMATSPDGITWTKYNDPSTTLPPFAESDPILPAGNTGSFDELGVLGAGVLRMGGLYHMYYSGVGPGPGGYRTDIGYAYSSDGIIWEKWPENPVYVQEDDLYFDPSTMIFEQPCILLNGNTVYLYYDYGVQENSLGMATAINPWVGTDDNKITNSDLRITNSPNPVYQSTTFSYILKEPGQVTLQIFDSFGRMVDEPVNAHQQKGEQRLTWNAEEFPAGIYHYRLQAGGEEGRGKMVVVR